MNDQSYNTDIISPYFWQDDSLCPCPRTTRMLQQDEFATFGPSAAPIIDDTPDDDDTETWQIVYTCLVLAGMFAALVSDKIGADSVMLTALTFFMAAQVISVEEGLAGFANEGLLTVLVLFVVAEGISRTGALDWWMGKLLGTPKTAADAQLRLMVPIAIISAFLNNTPVVAVMIPIVQRWAKNINVSPQQLLVPLSFASILGGTCTLIGTSTNLVVVGLLEERYPGDESVQIGLFDLGQYGVPVALLGGSYILMASPFLLPGGKGRQSGSGTLEANEDILLGARLTQWSPAAGRTVKRSGLRDAGGIYLVSVHRAATGNVHRAVSNDFVLNVGDILYFTGLVEGFGEFCEEHSLEVVTSEVHDEHDVKAAADDDEQADTPPAVTDEKVDNQIVAEEGESSAPILRNPLGPLQAVMENEVSVPVEVGVTKESLLSADYDERLRNINRMSDLIRGVEPADPADPAAGLITPKRRRVHENLSGSDPAKIVVSVDKDLVVLGINSEDRAGLLLDISKGLLRLNLQLHHTEAAVVQDRSISIWRCEVIGTDLPDLEEIWSVMNALLSIEGGIAAMKRRGLRVLRARIHPGSTLIGRIAAEVDFRNRYQAAIVAIQKGGKNTTLPLTQVRFDAGDVLVLQVGNDSHLLEKPPDSFYENQAAENKVLVRTPSYLGLPSLFGRRNTSHSDLSAAGNTSEHEATQSNAAEKDEDDSSKGVAGVNEGFDEEEGEHPSVSADVVWRDLQVILSDESGSEPTSASREFLTAMELAPKSALSGKTAVQSGLNKLPDLFLVSIERPVPLGKSVRRTKFSITASAIDVASVDEFSGSFRTDNQAFKSIPADEELQDGDVLWFSGPANAVGDLRKIPGLLSYENEEVEKINEKVFDRRLVQAVISRKGPLVGKTVIELQFREKFGAAVIAVHREGKRVHEHPGKVKLQAGDVLLLEAGPSFFARAGETDRSFALLAEVEDSAPPRLRLLLPALGITAAMLVVFTMGLTSLLVAGLAASILMVSLGILSEQEARDAINWDVFTTIAAAFGIGTALVNSGVASIVANALVTVGEEVGIGDAGLLGAVYFATFLISNVVTNNAAAALLFPIAMEAADSTGVDRALMSYSLMLGASASFMSPFGYTTNLMIYGPGGYRYKDFLVFGTPMQLVLWIATTAFLVVDDSLWYVAWLVSGALLLLVAGGRSFAVSLSNRISAMTEIAA